MASIRGLLVAVLATVVSTACATHGAEHPLQGPSSTLSWTGASNPLARTSWRFVELYGTPVRASSSAIRRRPQLAFDAGSRVFGSDGCNRLMGSYTIKQDRVLLGAMSGTQMACPDQGLGERHFREALMSAKYGTVEHGVLVVYGGTGRPLALLERRSAMAQ
jgi:heat shock protein HslJ